MKRAHPELFKVVRDLAVPLATLEPAGTCAHFAAIGNHFLLQKTLFQVQCSRRDFVYARASSSARGDARSSARGDTRSGAWGCPQRADELGRRCPEIARDATGAPLVAFASPAFEARREAALAAAARGEVLISPCVSDGERQIAREALEAGLPLIALRNKGFSPLQKPGGRSFDACAAGRLLLLAPAAWPYLPGRKPMTRDDATAMNRLCQWLAGDNAATINYHGLQPSNIDALAKAAVRVA